MNRNQRTVLFAAAAVLCGMLLFPPFQSRYPWGLVNAGYGFILSPPTYVIAFNTFNSDVNLTLLGVQFLFVATVGGLLCLALK